VDFDRKEDFRSSFKEDRKSNEAPKRCRKQAEASHGRAPGCTAVLQCPRPRTAVRPTVRGHTAGPCPQSRATCFFLRLFRVFLHNFRGALSTSLRAYFRVELGFILGLKKLH